MLNYNGTLYPEDSLLLSFNNRSFRYGDGFFETMKMVSGKILLWDYHFERLHHAAELLQFDATYLLSPSFLRESIETLAAKNGHSNAGRIRLTIFRGDGGVFDPDNRPNFVIQTTPLPAAYLKFHQEGLRIGVFPDARKSCDRYAQIKSNSYLPSVMAARWAKANNLDDALILNCFDRIAETAIANVFVVRDGAIRTPALTEGCVAGVLRRYLLQSCRKAGMSIEETTLTIDDILQSQEIFLTNAAFGIRWVRECSNRTFDCSVSRDLYLNYIATL